MSASGKPRPGDRLIVGLDTADVASARRVVEAIGDAASFYKIGLGLVFAGGVELARDLAAEGCRIFLDIKAHDIGQTVENAVRSVGAALAPDLLTVHAERQVMDAARRGRADAPTRLLAVTVLTNMNGRDLADMGLGNDEDAVGELVLARAGRAREAGMDGVVASGREARRLRETLGPEMLIVTPGIRLPGGDADDQRRITTPADAVADGADHLVVARPIIGAPDPRAAALRFQEEIAAAG